MIRLRQAMQPAIDATAIGGDAGKVAAAAAEQPKTPSLAYAVAWIAAAVGIVGGIIIADRAKPTAFEPADGFSALALFYILAQAVERIIEPFTGFVSAPSPDGGTAKKPEAEAKRALALALAYRAEGVDAKQAEADSAAVWHRVIEEIRNNTKIYAWGFATMLGALGSGCLGLYLMSAVGAKATPVWLDVAITGVIVGGGSKGLHDLIKNIEKAKENKEDPEEAS